MYSERMAQNKLKKMKKELEEHFDKRNEYILDKIFEGNIIVLGPENLIKILIEEKKLKIEAMRFEGKLTGYMFRKEFHTLYLVETDEDLRQFLIDVRGMPDIDIDKIVGFTVTNDKIGNEYGILPYDLKDEEFNRINVKKMIERVLPKVDDMFNSAMNDSMQEFTERIMLENLMSIAIKKNQKRG